MKNTEKYSGLTRWTHWLTAVFVIISLYSGMQMEETITVSMLRTHAISGSVLLVLLILRSIALRHKRPGALHDNPQLQRLYQMVHWALLICLAILVFTGMATFITEEFLPAIQDNDVRLIPDLKRTGMSVITKIHHILPKVLMLFLVLHLSGMILYWIRNRKQPFGRIV